MYNSPVEEIKSRLDIIEVIREYLSDLKQVGSNWKALCPFHNEKTPSFMVSQEKQIWHCFGSCNEGGDIFRFVMKQEGIEFPEALRLLAQKAGVILQKTDPKLTSQKTRILDILETSAKYFRHTLLNSPQAQIARDYLKKRKIEEKTSESFFLGYSLDQWDNLLHFLTSKGYEEKDIFLSGLTVKKEKGMSYYDRFRGRLMFPITDLQGAIIGFTARLLSGEEAAKYINTPQTIVYDKSNVLYGLDKAKKGIRKEDSSVIVEGNMDVITSHQAGITNVVASSGTALTLEQIRLLKRYSHNLSFCFDMDKAGQEAVKRGIDLSLEEGMNVKVIFLSEEGIKDPDEYIKLEGGESWREEIRKALPFMNYYFHTILKNLDLSEVENKKKAAKILLNQITKLPNQVEQMHYLQKLSNLLKVPEEILREALPRKKREKEFREIPLLKKRDRFLLIEEKILSLIVKFPENIDYSIKHLLPEMFQDNKNQEFYKNLIIYYNIKGKLKKLNLDDFNQSLSTELRKYLNNLELLADKDYSEFTEDQSYEEIINLIQLIKNNHFFSCRQKLEEEMKTAEERGDKKKIEELAEKFSLFI